MRTIKYIMIIVITLLFTSSYAKLSTYSITTYSSSCSNDSCYLYLVFNGKFTSGPCYSIDTSIITKSEDSLSIKICYIQGPLQIICYHTDTINLGLFRNGNMNIHMDLNVSYDLQCSNFTTIDTLFSTLITDIKEPISFNGNLLLYPNPTASTLTIQTDAAWQEATATLTNLEGRVVLSQALTNTQQQSLEIGHLPNGMYFVTVQSAQQKWVRRVVKVE